MSCELYSVFFKNLCEEYDMLNRFKSHNKIVEKLNGKIICNTGNEITSVCAMEDILNRLLTPIPFFEKTF